MMLVFSIYPLKQYKYRKGGYRIAGVTKPNKAIKGQLSAQMFRARQAVQRQAYTLLNFRVFGLWSSH